MYQSVLAGSRKLFWSGRILNSGSVPFNTVSILISSSTITIWLVLVSNGCRSGRLVYAMVSSIEHRVISGVVHYSTRHYMPGTTVPRSVSSHRPIPLHA